MTDDEARELVIALVLSVEKAPQAEDDALVAALVEQGFERIDAELAIAVVPTVFGRLALRRLGDIAFSPLLRAADSSGKTVDYRLVELPIYRAAARVAVATEVHGSLSREQFSRVGARSAESHAASRLLDAGSELTGAVFSPVTLCRVTAEDIGSTGRLRWWHRVLNRA